MIYLSDDGDAQLRDLMARCLRNLDDPYHERREEALRWLGPRYLLAQPVNRKPEHA